MLAPLNVTVRAAEFKYQPDSTPSAFNLDATVNGILLQLRTTYAGGQATAEGTAPVQGQARSVRRATVAPRTSIHANGVFGSYLALARRLVEDAEEGARFRVYVVPRLRRSPRGSRPVPS